MTLGDNQQPLTRREARELARQTQPVSPVDDEATTTPQAASDVPAEAPDTIQLVPTVPTPSEAAFTTLSRRELRSLMEAKAAVERAESVKEDADSSDGTFRDSEDDGIDDAADPDALEMVEIESDADATPVEGAQKLNPPVGHWSVARDVDDDVTVSGQHQPLDQLMARGIAAGGMPTTTNALILPSIPQQANPLASTGEVLVTGSIDLPRSLGSTGQHPNTFDSSEMDHMLDQLDEAAPTSSVAPVSASKAVSSHASTRGVMTPPKKQAISVPTVLSVTGGVLGVGVLALILAGPVFNLF